MSPRTEFRGLRVPGDTWLSRAAQTVLAASVVSAEALVLGPLVVLTRSHALQEAMVRHWSRTMLYLAGVDLTVEGAQNLGAHERFVCVSNHQSLLDVPCLITAMPNALRFVAKRSLLKVPIFGPAMRAIGTVDIDRRDRADAMRKLQEAQHGVGQRCSLHFFAEGTRSPEGQLLPFKKGAAAMAIALGVPILPIAVSGTRKVFRKGALTVRPGPIVVSIGKPIAPGADTPEERSRLVALARDQVARRLMALGEPVGLENDEQKGVACG